MLTCVIFIKPLSDLPSVFKQEVKHALAKPVLSDEGESQTCDKRSIISGLPLTLGKTQPFV